MKLNTEIMLYTVVEGPIVTYGLEYSKMSKEIKKTIAAVAQMSKPSIKP